MTHPLETERSRAGWLTPEGAAAVRVLRLEGESVPAFVRGHFRGVGSGGAGGLAFGTLIDGDEIIDEILLQRGSKGDQVDLHLHGGEAIGQRVIALACAQGFTWCGAREVDGDFADGDGIRAEALAGLAKARSREATLFFGAALEGGLSRDIRAMVAQLEESERIAGGRALEVESSLRTLLDRAPFGLAFAAPPRVALVGAVNAGKSTLLNALLGRERAVAADEEGTTRDAIEVEAEVSGYPFVIFDTAGRRMTSDPLERAGIARAEQIAATADLRLEVVDAESALDETMSPERFAPRSGVIVVLSRLDRLDAAARARLAELRPGITSISAQTGEGMATLRARLIFASPFGGPVVRQQVVPFSERQVEALREAARQLPRDPQGASRGLAMLLRTP